MHARKIILQHFFKGFLHFLCQFEIVTFGIILLAIVPYQLKVIEDLFNYIVLPIFEFLLNLKQIHGVLDNFGIVIEVQLYRVRNQKYLSRAQDVKTQSTRADL